MDDKPRNRLDLSAPIAALFVILTAWGNAIAMAVVSGLLLTGLLLFGGNRVPKLAAVSIACLVAFGVAFLIQAQ